MTNKLFDRSNGMCELCAAEIATISYLVSPHTDEQPEHMVGLCATCLREMNESGLSQHWQCLAGSIWNGEPSVQALTYRILYKHRDIEWANDILQSVQLDEEVVNWAVSAFEVKAVHRDSNGKELQNGDTIVTTQTLNVKGANFMAPKGTVVRKIRLVPDNVDQIEGKVNDQTIVILTRFVRKS